MSSYSFKDVYATLTDPTGTIIPLSGLGSGVAEEGISIEPTGDKNTMTVGADGSVMHSLSADESGVATIRYLQTSHANGLLNLLYQKQTQSALLHGHNVLTVTNVAGKEVIVSRQCAFKKYPAIKYGKEGAIMEWTFDLGHVVPVLNVVPDVGV